MFIFALLTIGTADTQVLWGLVVVALCTLGLPVWLALSTSYVVGAQQLNVRSGPFSWSIPLADINSVTASRSGLCSPALSLNRLEIDYGSGRKLLVSPVDLDGFKAALDQPRV
ncbi:PH domain-containing protein [Porticoccaceae bacterium]|nr:PH domain-containing protein [Porticoccaceae bacterium]